MPQVKSVQLVYSAAPAEWVEYVQKTWSGILKRNEYVRKTLSGIKKRNEYVKNTWSDLFIKNWKRNSKICGFRGRLSKFSICPRPVKRAGSHRLSNFCQKFSFCARPVRIPQVKSLVQLPSEVFNLRTACEKVTGQITCPASVRRFHSAHGLWEGHRSHRLSNFCQKFSFCARPVGRLQVKLLVQLLSKVFNMRTACENVTG